MSAVRTIVKNTFNKVFNNLAKEMNVPVEKIQLGIYYTGGKQKYEAYNQFKKEKDFEIGDYVGAIIDFSGGTAVIESTVAQSGASYAKELNVPVDSIKIIMAYKKDSLPDAVLMAEGKKVRNINLEKDFLS